MYYLAFTPLWILVILTDFFSIMDNEADLYTEKISIPCCTWGRCISVQAIGVCWNNIICSQVKSPNYGMRSIIPRLEINSIKYDNRF